MANYIIFNTFSSNYILFKSLGGIYENSRTPLPLLMLQMTTSIG